MGFAEVDQLTRDPDLSGRVAACATEQAMTFKDDARPDIASLAEDTLRQASPAQGTFNAMVAAAPGLADKATTEGGIDSSLIPDNDVLAAVQGNWPTVAALFYPPEP